MYVDPVFIMVFGLVIGYMSYPVIQQLRIILKKYKVQPVLED